MFRNVFSITILIDDFDFDPNIQSKGATYTDIRVWIKEKYGICVSNLNVSQAKQRLGLRQNEYKGITASGKYAQPVLNDEKFELIRTAFEHFGVI